MPHHYESVDTYGKMHCGEFASDATSYATLVRRARRSIPSDAVLLTLDNEQVPYRYQIA